jgi:hypothetical protein
MEPAGPVEGGAADLTPAETGTAVGAARPDAAYTDAEIRGWVADILGRLRSNEASAKAAFRELWNAPKEMIPPLIRQTDCSERSALREIEILVVDPSRFVRVDDKASDIIYNIPGMGEVPFDDIAVGQTRDARRAKVVLRSWKGFPLGVAIRAGLINRFRSEDYPAGSDRRDPVGWWGRFYERVKGKL